MLIIIRSYLKTNFTSFSKPYGSLVSYIYPSQDSIINFKLTFPIDCYFNKSSLTNICPKCKRTDRVVPIVYGLPIVDENGLIAGLQQGSFETGGCDISDCDPTWFCRRDSLRF